MIKPVVIPCPSQDWQKNRRCGPSLPSLYRRVPPLSVAVPSTFSIAFEQVWIFLPACLAFYPVNWNKPASHRLHLLGKFVQTPPKAAYMYGGSRSRTLISFFFNGFPVSSSIFFVASPKRRLSGLSRSHGSYALAT